MKNNLCRAFKIMPSIILLTLVFLALFIVLFFRFFGVLTSDVCTGAILLSLGVLFGLHFYFTIGLYLHERGHALSLELLLFEMRVNRKLLRNDVYSCKECYKIKFTDWNKAHTASPLLRVFASAPKRYSREIREVARAGVLYSSLLYLLLVCIFVLLSSLFSEYFLAPATAFATVYIMCSVDFFSGYCPGLDNKGKLTSQPDFFLVLHPEEFKNVHSK